MDTLKPIFEQAQQGNLKAYGQIVTQFQDFAVGYGYAILKDFDLAQDAAQEAFTEAWINISKIYDIYAFPALLRKIVFKYCDRLTRRGRHIEIMSMENLIEIKTRNKQPDQIFEIQEMQHFVQQAIDTLPEHERQVVSLFYISDCSQQEVATFLDVPISKVKNRLRSARKRLQERLFDMVKDNINQNRPSKDEQFVTQVLTVISPNKKDHSDALYQWLDDHYSEEMTRNGRIAHSHYDWQTSQIGLISDQLVAHIGVYDLQVQIGFEKVRMAGINLEKVEAEYKDKEVYTQTIQVALDAMYAHGYDMSCSRGVPVHEFKKLGYVNAWPDMETYYIRTEHMPTAQPNVELEEVHVNTIHDRQDLAALYNQWYKGLTGVAIRPTFQKGKCPPDENDPWPAYIFKDKAGNVVGYLYDGPNKSKEHNGRDLHITDTAGDPEQILRVIAMLARKYPRPRVLFRRIPYHSALAKRVRQLPYMYEVDHLDNNRYCQIRIINLENTLTKIAPELSRRLQKTHLKDYTGTLQIAIPDQSTTLVINNGEVTVHPNAKADSTLESGHEFAQLVIGKESPDEIIEMSSMVHTNDALELICTLFPAQHPQMPNEDL